MKLRRTFPFLFVLTVCGVVACGGASPTQPTIVTTTVAPTPPEPPPGGSDDNANPTPNPSPPPVPPAPGPIPPPDSDPSTLRWTATIASAHWVDGAKLPDTFGVELKGERVKVGTLPELPVIVHTSTAFAAGRHGTLFEAHVESTGWVWSYKGIEGQAFGTMKPLAE